MCLACACGSPVCAVPGGSSVFGYIGLALMLVYVHAKIMMHKAKTVLKKKA